MLPQTNVNNAYFNTTSLYTRPIFVNEISFPLTSKVVLHYCTFPLTRYPTWRWLNRWGRNM